MASSVRSLTWRAPLLMKSMKPRLNHCARPTAFCCPNISAQKRPLGIRNFRIAPDRIISGLHTNSTRTRKQSTAAGISQIVDAATIPFSPVAPTAIPQSVPISTRAVGIWLLGSAGLVFAIVVVGGLTRLTESGLSITEWKPVTGILPPLNNADWLAEFEKYKRTPEFTMHNAAITLPEFKFIYFMEYSHRILGRVIGLTFIVPAAYFMYRRRVTRSVGVKLVGIACLIGFQGFVGWWMVKSGIGSDLKDQGGVPRVSQKRLAIHLGTAFLVYWAMLRTGLDILAENKFKRLGEIVQTQVASTKSSARLRLFKGSVAMVTTLIFVTALSGALVAGLDAGLIYNDFPYMGSNLIPPTSELLSPLYARSDTDLVWRNGLENPTTVQFDHRIMATTTFFSILALYLASRRPSITLPIKRATTAMTSVALLQVTLGISTLLYLVPVPLAAAHQAGSLLLLTSAIVLSHRCTAPRIAARMLKARLPTSPGTSVPGAVSTAGTLSISAMVFLEKDWLNMQKACQRLSIA